MLSLFAKHNVRTFSRVCTLSRPIGTSRSLISISATESALQYQGVSFPYTWLRDSCQCPSCIHPSNKQKLHRTSDIDLDVTPSPDGVRVTDNGVEVNWKTGHKSSYTPQFLNRHSSNAKLSQSHRDAFPISWDLASIKKAGDLFVPYDSLESSAGLLSAITQLTQYGIVFITAAFEVLATTPVSFHYETDGHHLHRSHTTIEMETSSGASLQTQSIKCINYSPPFQAPLNLTTTPPSFYPALKEFAALLARPEATYEYLLKEGDAVIFDNRRVLHARTAFRDKEEQSDGETNRWLKGCYFEADTFLDKGRLLRAEVAGKQVK
ncbi:hypothetical protein HWV62_41358 [Athelia sp. TMB]|nr:hypothetical protein HWV62_41358 [Athelia sp. TMB]